MLSRRFATGFVGEDVLIPLLGLIILLTGVMYIFGGFRTGLTESHLFGQHSKWSWTAFILGLFEIVLGVMLVIEPMGRGSLVYTLASAWAKETFSTLENDRPVPCLRTIKFYDIYRLNEV